MTLTPCSVGWRLLLASIFLLALHLPNATAQECENIPPATNNCEDAPILCSFNEIDGYCTVTKPNNNYQAPNPLCPQGGAPHNPFWFAFYAGCPNLEIFLVPKNCGGSGIQAAIYGYGGDGLCPSSTEQPAEFVACMTLPCFNTPQTFMANNLTIGQIYYFMIDGCSGDTCTIEIFVNTNCGPPAIGPWPGQILGPSPICATGTAVYSIDPPEGGTVFHWYLDGDLIQEGGENSVEINWTDPGTYTLCVDVSNQCVEEFDNPSAVCREIIVYEVVTVDPPPVTICADETYTYAGADYPPGVHQVTLKTALYDCDSIVTLTVNGYVVTNAVDPEPVLICEDATYPYAGTDYPPGTHQVVLDNYFGCDSIITLQVNPDPHVTENLGTYYMCPADTIRIGGQLWYGDPPGSKEITIRKAEAPECDSTILFEIENIWVDPYIFPPDVLGCFIEQTLLDATGSVYNPINATLSYSWTALEGGVLGDPSDGPTMWVNTPGKYCVTVIAESPDGLFSCGDSVCIVVTSLPTPDVQAWVTDTLTCYTPQVTLTGSSQSPNVTYQWINPQGVVISTNTSTSVSTPGIYRFVVTDNTGCPNTAVVEVQANQAPPDVSTLPDTISCASPTAQLSGASATPGAQFIWKDPAGMVVGNAPTVPAPGAGLFTLVITNPVNGCQDSSTALITLDQAPPLASATTSTLTCLVPNPPLLGSTNIQDAVFTWRFGGVFYSSSRDTLAGQAGAYTLTVLNPANGCSADTLIIVPEDTAQPDAQANGDFLDCIKTTAQLTGTSATPGATFQWSFQGQPLGNTPAVGVTQPGIYTLVVTGPNGCTRSTTAEATLDADIPELALSASKDTLTCSTPTILLSAPSNMPVTWAWSLQGQPLSASGENLSLSAPGLYAVTVTAANGCTNSATILIEQDIALPVIDAVQGGVIDCNAATFCLQASSSTPGVTYQWFNQGGNPLAPGPSPCVAAAQTYTLVVTAYNGCTASATAQVTSSPDLPQNVVATLSSPINCTNTTVTIEVSSSTPGVTYQWSGPMGFASSSAQNLVSTPGAYAVTVTNPANGCTASDGFTIPIDTIAPLLTGTGPTLTCTNPGGTISVNVNNSSPGTGYTYQWLSPGGNTGFPSDPSLSISESGTWTVTVTNTTNGCTAVQSIAVQQNNTPPTLTLPPPASLTCLVTSTTLAAGSNTTVNYLWSGPGISGANQNIAQPQVQIPGSYQLTITNPLNGCTAQGSALVAQDTVSPIISLTGGTLTCLNPQIQILGTLTPSSGIAIQWQREGITIPGNSSSLPVTQPGTYTISVTNTSNGCAAASEILINEDKAPPAVTASGNEITCLTPQVTITGNSTTPGVDYLWTGPGSYASTDPISLVTEPGTYLLTVTAANGCTASTSAEVTEDRDLPQANASSSNILDCTNTTTTLSSSGSDTGTDILYTWTNPLGVVISNGASVGQVGTVGLYTLTVTNTLTGCTATATIQVTDNQNLPSALDLDLSDPKCYGRRDGHIHIQQVTGGTPPFLYSLNGGPFTPNAQFNGLGDGSYTITIQDGAGCLYTAPAVQLTEPAELVVDLGEDFILDWGRDTFLYALILPPQANIVSIQWTPAGVDTTLNAQEIAIQPFNQTLYGVQITDVNGCRAEDKVLVLVEKRRPVYIPNVFSPAGDENNRFYIQTGVGIEEIEVFEVFNRWGERVFRRANFQPNDPSLGWDGTIRNQPANPEVFVYYARIRFDDGIQILYKGDVTLLR